MNAQVNRDENTFWPWVLGLVVLALVVWVAAEVSGEGNAPVPEPAVVTAPVTRTTGESLQLWVRDSAEMQERSGDGRSYAARGCSRARVPRASGEAPGRSSTRSDGGSFRAGRGQ